MLLYIVIFLYIIIYSGAILCAPVRVFAPPWGCVRVRASFEPRARVDICARACARACGPVWARVGAAVSR